MEINPRHPLGGTAAALDDHGNYWFLNVKSEPASHTHPERPLPGYDIVNFKAGEIRNSKSMLQG